MDIKLILKGFIIGIGKIIPGFSGALLAISFNVYDKLIDSITNFFNNKKDNFLFLLNISTGILLGIILFSNIILYLLNNYYIYTSIFFLGLIIGGTIPLISNINKNKKNITISLLAMLIILFISIFTTNNNYIIKNSFIDNIYYIYAGFLEAIGTIIPGVSATALLMLNGLYNIVMTSISTINIKILIPFLSSFLLSTILLLKLTNYCIKKYYQTSYSIIIGISIGTIIILFINLIKYFNIYNILFCIMLLYFTINLSKKYL